MIDLNCKSGTYLLEILLTERTEIKLHSKIHIFFPGWYYYSGSAQKSLDKRVNRHIVKSKKVHWHIDKVTTLKNSIINRIFVFCNTDKNNECFNISFMKSKGLKTNIMNFGNGDCINNCSSHLLFTERMIDAEKFFLPEIYPGGEVSIFQVI